MGVCVNPWNVRVNPWIYAYKCQFKRMYMENQNILRVNPWKVWTWAKIDMEIC